MRAGKEVVNTRLHKLSVALINVVVKGDYQYEQEIPLGLACIGAFLRTHGYNMTFEQFFAGTKFTDSVDEEKFKKAAEIEADVYGFQLNMVNYYLVKALVEKIKSRRPEAITIFGGPYLVSLSEAILENEPLYDFMVVGEGEVTVLELLQSLERPAEDFSHIKGLVWRDASKKAIRNVPRDLIEDLNSLPFPARDFLEDARRDPKDSSIVESVRMITSRGCVGKCNFCCVNLYNKVQKGKTWRGRSPKNVVDELEYLHKVYKAKHFNFSDSSFEDPGKLGKSRSRQICEEIIERGLSISTKIYLRCETIRTEEDIELLKLYKRAGVDVVIIGVESASDYELEFYEKHAVAEDNYRTAGILREQDLFYVLTGFLMFGPNSTMDTIRQNIEFLYKFGFADNIMPACNVLMLFRDSKLYRILKEEGRVVESGKYCELPKYVMKDPLAVRMSRHWQDPFARFPVIKKVNKLQINTGNLVSRMTNPMNAEILDALRGEFLKFKDEYRQLSSEFAKLQYDYFIYTMKLVEEGCSDEKLDSTSHDFFVKTYENYLPLYDNLYNSFINTVTNAGFSLSGLTFKHILSSMLTDEIERVIRKSSITVKS